MQFVITGKDGNDAEAPNRRLAVREAHLEGMKQLKAAGVLQYAAALCDEQGQMNGSTLVMDFPSRDAINEWLKDEPYVTGAVWKEIEIVPCKVASMFLASA